MTGGQLIDGAPLCKDCKYWQPSSITKETGWSQDNYDKCMHSRCTLTTNRFERVRGSQLNEARPLHCHNARAYDSYCGQEGEYFEPRTVADAVEERKSLSGDVIVAIVCNVIAVVGIILWWLL